VSALRDRRKARAPRLWPAFLILALAAAALAWIWRPGEPGGSMTQPTLTVIVGLMAGLLLLGWWLLLSRTRLLTRVATVLALVAFAGTASLVVEYRGLSGDLVPRFAWRRRAPAAPNPSAHAPAPARLASPAIPDRTHASGTATDPTASPGPTPSSGSPSASPSPAARLPAPRDFPQFLGPNRDATLRGLRLARDWSPSPPVRVWRQPIGAGWSGFAVAQGLAVTLEEGEEQESITAFAVDTGAQRWTRRIGDRFSSPMGGPGPRATPAIADGRVYALGPNGQLTAHELASGRVLFARDVLSENGARRPEHGVTASPLVVDGLVLVLAGGPNGRSLVAYDAGTGERRWSGGDDPAAYSSPRVATLGGVRQVLVFSLEHLAGHDLSTGAVLWQDPWPQRAEKVSQPVVLDDGRVFVSMGYGVGGRMVKVEATPEGGWRARTLWSSRQLKAKFTQVVAHDGFLYGLDEGVLVCLDPRDGERRWKSGRYGHGQVLLVDDLLLVQAEDGEVVMVQPNPERHVERSRFQAVSGRAWATPALAGDLLLVRGDGEAACYRLPLVATETAGAR
jgi:outer membrane protein assembly factor BamB